MAALLVSFLLLMILGCPIAFCLLCSGTIYFMTNNMALIMVVQRLTEGANTFTLLAVPGFILAGNLMNSGEVTAHRAHASVAGVTKFITAKGGDSLVLF